MGYPWSEKKPKPSEKGNSTTICPGNDPDTSWEATFFTLSAVSPEPHICLCGQKTAKITFYSIKAPLRGPALYNADPMLPSTACPSSPLPCLYVCMAHTVLPQACQYPSTAEGNSVCGLFSSCSILWFVRTTAEPMKCIHTQRWLQTPQKKGRHADLPAGQPVHVMRQKLKGMQVEFLQQATDKTSCNKNHFRRQAAPPNMQLSKGTTGGGKSKDT